ncbi:MAG: hypothetical protein OEQ28_05520, partial [Acidobacteriota bacterium]|nr:hypothetical protein [Acidobacteriota bacterium]
MIQAVERVRNYLEIQGGFARSLNFKARCYILLCFIILFATPFSYSQTDDDGPLFEIEFDRSNLVLPCPAGCERDVAVDSCKDAGKMEIAVKINARRRGSRDVKIWYDYGPETGSITETATGLVWNLGDAGAGTHWLKVKMNEGFETIESVSKSVDVGRCDCVCTTPCASFELSADKSETVESGIVMLRAVQNRFFKENIYLSWNVANGEILSGQGSNIVRVQAGSPGELLVN